MRSFQGSVQAAGAGAPTPDEVTAYILEMLLELTGLALTVGEDQLGAEISELLGRHAERAVRGPVTQDESVGLSRA